MFNAVGCYLWKTCACIQCLNMSYILLFDAVLSIFESTIIMFILLNVTEKLYNLHSQLISTFIQYFLFLTYKITSSFSFWWLRIYMNRSNLLPQRKCFDSLHSAFKLWAILTSHLVKLPLWIWYDIRTVCINHIIFYLYWVINWEVPK